MGAYNQVILLADLTHITDHSKYLRVYALNTISQYEYNNHIGSITFLDKRGRISTEGKATGDKCYTREDILNDKHQD